MIFNFLTNIGTCASPASISEFLGVGNLGIVYYTHIPTVLISLLIGILVLIKNKNSLVSKILFSLSLFFLVWVILDIFTWVSFDSRIIMFTWSLTAIFQALIYIASLYFIYVFINRRDLPLYQKVLIALLFLPIIILTPTHHNLYDFYYSDCTAIDSGLLNSYIYIFQFIIVAWIILVSIFGIVKTKGVEKKEAFLASLGIVLFLVSFFVTGYMSVYLADKGILAGYAVESYGLFGMIVFMAFLAYLIVKFKVFNIKFIAAQVLVWSLVILIGSQFFYLDKTSLPIIIITSITLIIASILGLNLVRSVKKEIALKEKLEIANAGQTNLIHVMNHQIKGYLGTDRSIFAELLTDDYGSMPEATKPLLQRGLEASSSGVEYVTEILKGASAENGTLPYEMKPMDLKNLVSEVAAKQKEIADKKGLKFNFNVSSGNYNMVGDVLQLGEAIRNLINNSISYTPAGSVSVDLSPTGNLVQLIVKDTGVGIKEEDKGKLFKAGGVGQNSIKVNVNSSGYGLVFAKAVVEAHKGKIWFESAGEGKGTTFFVDLPVVGK